MASPDETKPRGTQPKWRHRLGTKDDTADRIPKSEMPFPDLHDWLHICWPEQNQSGFERSKEPQILPTLAATARVSASQSQQHSYNCPKDSTAQAPNSRHPKFLSSYWKVQQLGLYNNNIYNHNPIRCWCTTYFVVKTRHLILKEFTLFPHLCSWGQVTMNSVSFKKTRDSSAHKNRNMKSEDIYKKAHQLTEECWLLEQPRAHFQ